MQVVQSRDILFLFQIPVIADLPVGDNLQDHLYVETFFSVDHPVSLTPATATSYKTTLHYGLNGGGNLMI